MSNCFRWILNFVDQPTHENHEICAPRIKVISQYCKFIKTKMFVFCRNYNVPTLISLSLEIYKSQLKRVRNVAFPTHFTHWSRIRLIHIIFFFKIKEYRDK